MKTLQDITKQSCLWEELTFRRVLWIWIWVCVSEPKRLRPADVKSVNDVGAVGLRTSRSATFDKCSTDSAQAIIQIVPADVLMNFKVKMLNS